MYYTDGGSCRTVMDMISDVLKLVTMNISGMSYRVDVGDVTNVSEVHTLSTFRVEVSRLVSFLGS